MVQFNVMKSPPSEADIARGHYIEVTKVVCAVIGTAIAIGGLLSTIALNNPYLLFVTVFGVVLMLIRMVTDFVDYSDLPEDSCGSFLNLCNQTDEGIQYRLAVLAQGRKFVNEELRVMRAWVEGRQNRAACKQLYDIESPPPSGPAPQKSKASAPDEWEEF